MIPFQTTFAAPEPVCLTSPTVDNFRAFVAGLEDLVEIEALGVDDVWDPALDSWIRTAEAMRSEVVIRAKRVILLADGEIGSPWLTKVCANFITLMNSSDTHEYTELAQTLGKRPWRQETRSMSRATMTALDEYSGAFETLLQCPDYRAGVEDDEPVRRFDQAA